MGRKIPGKKHRGVKDPNKQRAKRLSELKLKINDPPKNVEDQHIPKSLQRVIKLKDAAKNRSLIKKKKKKKSEKLICIGEQNVKPSNISARPDKIIPIFNQKPNESVHHFWNRVNKETHDFIKETEFETKFNVDVKRDMITGEIESVEKKPKDSLTKVDKLKAKHKNIYKKKNVTEGIKLTKHQKRKQKLLKKKEKNNLNNFDDFDRLKDKVEFGELVHAPPELKVHPRSTNKNPDKIKHKNLLLNSILHEKELPHNENKNTLITIGKRKNLPVGERRQIEKQQNDVIATYRLLKAKKFGRSTIST